MKLRKFILCLAIALTAFGVSLGILEIGSYLRSAFAPAVKVRIKPPIPVQMPIFAPQMSNISPPPAAPEPVGEAEPEDWGHTGDYYIVDEKPKGFEDFSNLYIVDHEYNEKTKRVERVKPNGVIEIWREGQENIKEFKFSSIDFDGKRISAVTKTKRGVSYQFDGRFVEQEVQLKDEKGEKYTEIVYLKGRLSKWRDGKKIAEAKVRFGISHGC